MLIIIQIRIGQLEQLSLPQTPLMLENACFIMQEDKTIAWPLMCDPSSRVIDWVKDFMNECHIVDVKYHVSVLSFRISVMLQ